MTINDEDMKAALDRIARTADGYIMFCYFQTLRMGFLHDPDPSPGALRENNAHRKFASEIIGLMSKGIEESGRSIPGRDRPIIVVRSGPVDANPRARDNPRREFIRTNDPELAGLVGGDGRA